MQKLNNKRIIVGITGGIAAYKAAELVRLLHRYGADVRVVMTQSASEFITPLTLQALSGNPVHTSLLDTEAEAAMGHIELARWADAVVIAPASANFIAQMTAGLAGELLYAIVLATCAPVCIVPAMNKVMWENKATQDNILRLRQRQIKIFYPVRGEQACGDIGFGRMPEPETIAQKLTTLFQPGLLDGKQVLITAGPTREKIDPVRYLSNNSSGKMGFALTSAAVEAGASVTLIAGPVSQRTPERVRRIDVESAVEMQQAVLKVINTQTQDIFIACAAVADYRPQQVMKTKIKKTLSSPEETLTLQLTLNPDILMSVAALQQHVPFLVGFAAETDDLMANAKEKMRRKNLDMIILNDVANPAIGFNSDNNAVTVLGQALSLKLPVMSKQALSRKLISLIAEAYARKVPVGKKTSPT
ncbi:MAG: bifunctional phosphopantothenoylcysteine decarboxylase/phosphopantothenate--cysteine ligase CoaBC [Endozoicomonadaceae bacterium]|nr:bifunctional phosphopantothenoylcysteine decarboxylase/phosphopantothenate--cysteine ligase CoaBC [Endozoicomonadaceae bacterium]